MAATSSPMLNNAFSIAANVSTFGAYGMGQAAIDGQKAQKQAQDDAKAAADAQAALQVGAKAQQDQVDSQKAFAAQGAADQLKKAAAMTPGSTILTSGLGVQSSGGPAPKTILGA